MLYKILTITNTTGFKYHMLEIMKKRSKMCEISLKYPAVIRNCDCVLESSCCSDVKRQLILFICYTINYHVCL